jgi:hypothetical protein
VDLAQVYGVGNKGGEAVSDRELLELAAKAAGIRINYWVYDNNDDSPSVLESGGLWNPLDDDGDALRLAVKLFDGDDMEVIWYNARRLRAERPELDEVAAIRLAIVRAAAEIGRNMT